MDKEQILDRFAEAYRIDGFPPLAGRIMGILYISDSKYLSFDELIQASNARKGSVSKVLKLLISLKRISYKHSEEKKGKRLFYLDIKGTKLFLELIIDNYKNQHKLLNECLQLRSSENVEINTFIENSMAFNNEVITFIDEKKNQYFN